MRRWLGDPDRRAVAVLLGIPLVAFVVPALFGHPAVVGDNLIQNFPLRVLSGEMIAGTGTSRCGTRTSGRGARCSADSTPVRCTPGPCSSPSCRPWRPGWSTCWPPTGRRALGLYLLLRQFRLAPLASLLAAASYAFAGAMVGQMVHLSDRPGHGMDPPHDPGTGAPVVGPLRQRPDRRSERTRSSPWPWVALLAGTIGLVLLTGEPRGIAEAEVVGVVVALWLVLRRTGGRSACAQGWPTWGGRCSGPRGPSPWHWSSCSPAGASSARSSQRASETYTFFGTARPTPTGRCCCWSPTSSAGPDSCTSPPTSTRTAFPR